MAPGIHLSRGQKRGPRTSSRCGKSLIEIENTSDTSQYLFSLENPSTYSISGKDKKIYEVIEKAAKRFAEKTGSKTGNVSLKYADLAVQAYYPIVYVEFFSGTRKFDGRRYGKKIEDSCGEEVLRRMLGGKEISRAEHAGKYYRKALMAKELITAAFEKAFREVDIIMSPVTPMLPHKLGEKISPKAMYAYDAFTIPANLAGICAGVVKAGEVNGVPVGLQLMAPRFREELLLKAMKQVEETNEV